MGTVSRLRLTITGTIIWLRRINSLLTKAYQVLRPEQFPNKPVNLGLGLWVVGGFQGTERGLRIRQCNAGCGGPFLVLPAPGFTLC